jgi:hypothetical protein
MAEQRDRAMGLITRARRLLEEQPEEAGEVLGPLREAERLLARRVRHERAQRWKNRENLEIRVNVATGERTVRVKRGENDN